MAKLKLVSSFAWFVHIHAKLSSFVIDHMSVAAQAKHVRAASIIPTF